MPSPLGRPVCWSRQTHTLGFPLASSWNTQMKQPITGLSCQWLKVSVKVSQPASHSGSHTILTGFNSRWLRVPKGEKHPHNGPQLSLSFRFNGHFPGGPGLTRTRMSPLWILLEPGMMEVVVKNCCYMTC